jgi:ATP-dependent DNA ligase
MTELVIGSMLTSPTWLRTRRGYPFDDGVELSAAAERMGLEAVVSTRLDAPYQSGTISGWVKVKTQSWRKANESGDTLPPSAWCTAST